MNVGQIVTILDLGLTGIITRNDSGVFQVTTLDGTKWAREITELALANETDAEAFARDIKILAPHHTDLAEAFAQVITPMDTVVPGVRLKDIRLSTTMPSGNIVTRRQVAAEMIRTNATRRTPVSLPYFPRSVAEVI